MSYGIIQMGWDFQKEFTHGIPIEKKVRKSRYSLTFRTHTIWNNNNKYIQKFKINKYNDSNLLFYKWNPLYYFIPIILQGNIHILAWIMEKIFIDFNTNIKQKLKKYKTNFSCPNGGVKNI